MTFSVICLLIVCLIEVALWWFLRSQRRRDGVPDRPFIAARRRDRRRRPH